MLGQPSRATRLGMVERVLRELPPPKRSIKPQGLLTRWRSKRCASRGSFCWFNGRKAEVREIFSDIQFLAFSCFILLRQEISLCLDVDDHRFVQSSSPVVLRPSNFYNLR